MYEDTTSGPTWDGSGVVYAKVFEALARLPQGACVLDAGCGNGYLASEFARRGLRSFGTDTSEAGIAVARGAYPDVGFACTDLAEESVDLPQMDAVTCIEVLEHVHLPRVILSRLLRVLKPGGLLVLTTPYHGYVKNLAVVASGRFDSHFNPLWDDGHVKFFSRRTLTTALLESGFTSIAIDGVGRVPYLWKTMLATAVKPAG